MELVIGQNSYITVAEADDIVASNFISTSTERKIWNNLDDNDKAVIISSTTNKYDTDAMIYKGSKLNREQKLQFPRKIHNKIVECPNTVKIGLVLQALSDLRADSSEEADLRLQGIKSFADGSGAKIEFNETIKNSVCGLNINIWHRYFSMWSMIC